MIYNFAVQTLCSLLESWLEWLFLCSRLVILISLSFCATPLWVPAHFVAFLTSHMSTYLHYVSYLISRVSTCSLVWYLVINACSYVRICSGCHMTFVPEIIIIFLKYFWFSSYPYQIPQKFKCWSFSIVRIRFDILKKCHSKATWVFPVRDIFFKSFAWNVLWLGKCILIVKFGNVKIMPYSFAVTKFENKVTMNHFHLYVWGLFGSHFSRIV